MPAILSRLLIMSAVGVSSIGGVVAAAAAQPAVQAENDALQAKLVTRIDQVAAKLDAARQSGQVSGDRETAIKARLGSIRAEAADLSSKQGFLSAAESATYNRVLDEIEAQLAG